MSVKINRNPALIAAEKQASPLVFILLIPLSIALVFLCLGFFLFASQKLNTFLYAGSVCLILYFQFVFFVFWKKRNVRKQKLFLFQKGIETTAQIEKTEVHKNEGEQLYRTTSFVFSYTDEKGNCYTSDAVLRQNSREPALNPAKPLALLFHPQKPEQFCVFINEGRFSFGTALKLTA